MCNCIPKCIDRQKHINRLIEKLQVQTALPIGLRDSEYIFALKFIIKYEKQQLTQ